MEHPYPKGTRVAKCKSEPGKDTHTDGAMATVVCALGPAPEGTPTAGHYGYFVIWDDFPGIPIFIGDDRVKPI